MKVTWILDPDSFPDYQALVAEINFQGHLAATLPLLVHGYEWGDTSRFYEELAPAESCVVCHAGFEFTDLVAEDELWTPGTYGSSSAFNCSSYYPKLSHWLLNRDYEFVPRRELAANANSLFSSFGVDGLLFIRPDSGKKPFAGRLFSKADVDRWQQSSRLAADALVVVSSPKRIGCEWRFVVVDGSIVAASMYREDGQIHKSRIVKEAAYDFAALAAKGSFQPDRVWVLDTCETAAGEMFVLELNGFSSSDWYCCDPKSVIASVSHVALDDWKRSRS